MSYYTDKLKIYQKKYKGLIENSIKEILNKDIKELKNLTTEEERTLLVRVNELIELEESPISHEHLAMEILHSRSGIGGCAMTSYTCKLCDKEDMWGNTATPGICHACATKMAKMIARRGSHILKKPVK